MRTAVFAGSFDPITLGHFDILSRASHLFDRIIVGIGKNSAKKSFFDEATRLKMLDTALKEFPNIEITAFDGLTVDLAKKYDAKFLLRGLRNGQDLEYEKPIALLNKHMENDIETVYFVSEGRFAHISSTLVREIIKYGRDPEGLVPESILSMVKNYQPA